MIGIVLKFSLLRKKGRYYNLIFRSGYFTAKKIPKNKKIPAIVKYTQSNPVSGPGKYETNAPKVFFNNIPIGNTNTKIKDIDHRIVGSIYSITTKIFEIMS